MAAHEDGRSRRQRIVQEVNRRVESLSARWQPDGAFLLVLCECGTAGCTARVEVPHDLFAELLLASNRFVMVPGHEWDGDRVIERRESYVIAEPAGAA